MEDNLEQPEVTGDPCANCGQPALGLATKAEKLQPDQAFVQATLILAYHFTGDAANRDALMKKAFAQAADSSDRTSIQYARDVMDHKEKFRD